MVTVWFCKREYRMVIFRERMAEYVRYPAQPVHHYRMHTIVASCGGICTAEKPVQVVRRRNDEARLPLGLYTGPVS